jgi:hypothetical protein
VIVRPQIGDIVAVLCSKFKDCYGEVEILAIAERDMDSVLFDFCLYKVRPIHGILRRSFWIDGDRLRGIVKSLADRVKNEEIKKLEKML